MRINVHGHIFNFRSVFGPATLEILLDRLGSEGWPDFLVKAAQFSLNKLLSGENFDEQELVRDLVGTLNADKKFKKWLDELGEEVPGDLQILAHGDLDDILVGGARELLAKLGDFLSRRKDIENQTIQDFLAFLLLGISHSILDVADKLVEVSGPDAVMTALMMDITDGKGKDEGQFAQQIEDTSRAALLHPGRILPFVAVNPIRPTHRQWMTKAILERGCVGVKLYPSLGYSVKDHPDMDAVFAWCEQNEIPVLTHCNQGGFRARKSTIPLAGPDEWIPVLEKHPNLRVCFAHFGGDENLVLPEIPKDSWSGRILELIRKYPQVYTDIAYHTQCMDGGDRRDNYFRNLETLLGQAPYQKRILFGSDFYLVRLRLREDNLWRYFEQGFSASAWKAITQTNPAEYLGLSGGGGAGSGGGVGGGAAGGPRANILGHLRWLATHNTEVGHKPAAWVDEAMEGAVGHAVQWFPNEFGTRWTDNNDAHYWVFVWLHSNLRADKKVNHDFQRLGKLRVRDLKDWPVESRPNKERTDRIRAMSISLSKFLLTEEPKGAGATLEKGVSLPAARNALAGTFANGNLELHQLGPITDRLFRFAKESMPA